MIKGKSLLYRVWLQACKAKLLDDVIVATDDKRIFDHARGFGAKVCMTSRKCASGTDRLAEIARKYETKASAILNVQGDEPLIPPKLIDNLAKTLRNERNVNAVTAAFPLIKPEDINNPAIAKVVLDRENNAIFFSRSPLPFDRSGLFKNYYKHIGLYGFRRAFLLEFASWKQTKLERAECLEQLRIIENCRKIKVLISDKDSFGVDVPKDIIKIESCLNEGNSRG
jgi:3-deoxy-manno-octulosonate cytidylyltransferase (CMP-KDO synthetase)